MILLPTFLLLWRWRVDLCTTNPLDWGQEEKGTTTEDEMVGWHHRLNGHEFAWTPGVGDGQGGLACCSPWGCKESDTTERLNWAEPFLWSFPGGSDGIESACNAGDLGSNPGSWRSPGKGNATHSSILAWRIPWTEEPGRLQSTRLQRIGHAWATNTPQAFGKGNGNLLQCSRLGKPTDRGA